MGRKIRLLVVLAALAAALVGATEWLAETGAVRNDVAWSPMYEQRATDALIPWTAQAVYAGSQQEPTRDCQPTTDCVSAAAPCGETADCQETFDCKPTLDDTCRGAWTCEGWPTCAGTATCEGPDCTPSTFDAALCDGPTVEGPTCFGPRTCDALICDWPTYGGATCTRPTCSGPTCFGETCDGPTCFLMECDVLDYGDAPEIPGTALQYATTKASDGARHIIDGVYWLGERLDAESDGQPAELALGDDDKPYRRGDDEDGIWFSTTFNPGRPAVVIAAASQAGRLFAWIDYDFSGTWIEPSDAVFPDGTDLVPGYNWIVINVPEDVAASSSLFARFRFAHAEILPPSGEAPNGEVEDYRVPISATLRAWVMTDDAAYSVGEPIRVRYYVSETSQVTLIRHRADGDSDVLWSSVVEAGRHGYPDPGVSLAAVPPEGTGTLELIATSLQSAGTVWLTTPYLVLP